MTKRFIAAFGAVGALAVIHASTAAANWTWTG